MMASTLESLTRSASPYTLVDGTGRHQRRNPSGTTDFKIFEVQSAATGDGVYTCREQTLDATEWDDTAGDAKFDELNTTEVEVLNLLENDPEATYKEALLVLDKIKAWQMRDDEGGVRWVGIPVSGGNQTRIAQTTQAAPADIKITANLLGNGGNEKTSGLGSGIDVYCIVTPNTTTTSTVKLNSAIPRLVDNQYIFVTNIQGKWWCTTIFQVSEDCVCS
jgi:hypothetical protein